MSNKNFGLSVFIFIIIFYCRIAVPAYALEDCPANFVNPDIVATCTMTYNSSTGVINAHPSVNSGATAIGLWLTMTGPGFSRSAPLDFGYDYSTTIPAGTCGTIGCTLHYRYDNDSVCTFFSTGHDGPFEPSCITDVCYRNTSVTCGQKFYPNGSVVMCQRSDPTQVCTSTSGCIWPYAIQTNQSLPSWGDTINIPCATNTPTPSPTNTPTPTSMPTSTPTRTPTPTSTPANTPTPTPTGTIPPPTSTPTSTPTPTNTPNPAATSTPTPTSAPAPYCGCNGFEYTDLTPGLPVTFTAYGKVESPNINPAQVDNMIYHVEQEVEQNWVEIAVSSAIPASGLLRNENGANIYSTSWNYTVPGAGTGIVHYRVWAKINCSVRIAKSNYFSMMVLGTTSSNQSFWGKVLYAISGLLGRNTTLEPQAIPPPTPTPTPTVMPASPTPAGVHSLKLATMNPLVDVRKTCNQLEFWIDYGWMSGE